MVTFDALVTPELFNFIEFVGDSDWDNLPVADNGEL
jgi:hypothetical protein